MHVLIFCDLHIYFLYQHAMDFSLNKKLSVTSIYLILTLLLLLLLTLPLRAQEQSKPLRVALPDEASLQVHSAGKFEQIVNLMREYWHEWSIDNQRPVQFIRIPSARSFDALHNNEVDVIAISAAREYPNTLFSIPYAKYHQRIFRRLDAADTSQIVMAIHSPSDRILAALTPSVRRTFYRDIDVLLDNYQQYNAIYSVQPWEVEQRLKERGLSDVFYISENDTPDIFFRFAFRKSDEKFALKVNDSLRNVSKLQAQLWTDKYITRSENRFDLTLGDYDKTLSPQEKRFVLNHPHLKFPSMPEGFPPYLITDSFNHIGATGFSVDLLKVLVKRLGVTFEPVYVSSFDLARESIKANELDFYHLHINDPERYPHLRFSNTLVNMNFSLITRDDYVLNNHISSLKNEKVGLINGFASADALMQKLPNADFNFYLSITDAFKALEAGEINAFVEPTLSASYFIRQKGSTYFTIQPFHGFIDEMPLAFATSQRNADLILLFNRGLNSIDSEEYEGMYAKWSTVAFSKGDIYQQVSNVYQRAGYILLTIFVMSVLMTIFYLHQLKLRKAAQKEVEKALVVAEKARAAAEKSGIAKTSFLARMSHEIRTPMNGVFGMAEALRYTDLDKHQSELLNTLTSSADNLLSILNDVLDFSKMDAGKLTLESVPVNLGELAKNVVNAFTPLAHQKGLRLKLNVDDELATQYMLDPTRLTQVLNNLVSNALKFTEFGYVEVNIALSKREQIDDALYDSVNISVIDTGIGIAPEQQNLLFSPFIQADSAVTRRFGGTGLGLSICQEIVNAMGGKIATQSEHGKGSTFFFNIALKTVASTPVKAIAAMTKEKPELPDFSKLSVLLVEDNIVNIKVLTAQLERLRIHPDLAYNGEEGLALHKQNQYDLIISDCHMPIMDGFELAQTLSSAPKTRPFWLVAVTADALADTAQKCLDAGFDDYMTKPCPQDEITEKMTNAFIQLRSQKGQFSQPNVVPQTEPLQVEQQLFDAQRLINRNNQDKVLTSHICQLYVDTWQDEKQQLLAAIEKEDFEQAYAIAHKLEGSLRYLAVCDLDEQIADVEKFSSAQDINKLEPAVNIFVESLAKVAEQIQGWLTEQD